MLLLPMKNTFFKKTPAHAYFKHRIFPKSFGGKIRHIWTDVIYRMNKEKTGACVL